MCGLCGQRRDRYVSQHPSGIIMNILGDGPAAEEEPAEHDIEAHFGPRMNLRADVDSITTVESRSVSGSPTLSPRSPHASPVPSLHGLPETVPEGSEEPGLSPPLQPLPPPAFGNVEPWVLVPGDQGDGGERGPSASTPPLPVLAGSPP